MEKCSVVYVQYVSSDTIEKQGKRSDIQKYLKKGYYVKQERNGYWVLTRPSKVNVKISNSLSSGTFNMKHDILDFYCRDKISEKLVEQFDKDIVNNKIGIYMDANANYEIKSMYTS